MADLRYRPRPDALRKLISSFHRASNPESLCILLAERIAQDPAISGLRVYTLRPGDVCDICSHTDICEKPVSCLHLVSAAGAIDAESAATDRLPLTEGLGAVVRHAEPVVDSQPDGSTRLTVPMKVHDEPIGLVVLYARKQIPADRLVWLLLLLDAASASLQNLRSVNAYESWIEELGAQNDLMRGLLGEGMPDSEEARQQAGLSAPKSPSRAKPAPANGSYLTEEEMRAFEKENTREVLEQANWRVYGDGGAAELLGIRPTTLTSRINKMGLKKPEQSREK